MKHIDLVIIGLGYVGLPLAKEAVRSRLTVAGYDHSPTVTEGLNSGGSHIDDIGDADITATLADGFFATSNKTGVTRA
jgi:UDP-N-acetyl-D-glucosamine dehydrogenase